MQQSAVNLGQRRASRGAVVLSTALLLNFYGGVCFAQPTPVDNGDGTFTVTLQPGPGLNDGTDNGGFDTGKDA